MSACRKLRGVTRMMDDGYEMILQFDHDLALLAAYNEFRETTNKSWNTHKNISY